MKQLGTGATKNSGLTLTEEAAGAGGTQSQPFLLALPGLAGTQNPT